MKKIYNKLVRDNIPEIILKDNKKPKTSILSESKFRKQLEKKLLEECNEYLKAYNKEDRIEELADILEIINTLAKLETKPLTDIIAIAETKRENRGGFEKRIFLESVIDDNE